MSTSNVSHFTALPLGFALVDGGAAGDITVSGITLKDELLYVGSIASASDVLSTSDLTEEFDIDSADTINNTGGTSSANGALLVIWQKNHPHS